MAKSFLGILVNEDTGERLFAHDFVCVNYKNSSGNAPEMIVSTEEFDRLCRVYKKTN